MSQSAHLDEPSSRGYVYCLFDPSKPHLVKIGNIPARITPTRITLDENEQTLIERVIEEEIKRLLIPQYKLLYYVHTLQRLLFELQIMEALGSSLNRDGTYEVLPNIIKSLMIKNSNLLNHDECKFYETLYASSLSDGLQQITITEEGRRNNEVLKEEGDRRVPRKVNSSSYEVLTELPRCLAPRNKETEEKCGNTANPAYSYYVCGKHESFYRDFVSEAQRRFGVPLVRDPLIPQSVNINTIQKDDDTEEIDDEQIFTPPLVEESLNGLLNHRQKLLQNPHRYIIGKDRAFDNFAEKVYKWYYLKHCENCQSTDHFKFRSISKRILELIYILAGKIFDAQGGKPLYEYTTKDGLPRAWNNPTQGYKDNLGRPIWITHHIEYHIGHLISDSRGGSWHPSNLSFQSARCNLHVQSSLNFYETTEYELIEEVKLRIDNLFDLHKTDEWMRIIKELDICWYNICT
jgi:hypothetical protein